MEDLVKEFKELVAKMEAMMGGENKEAKPEAPVAPETPAGTPVEPGTTEAPVTPETPVV